MVTRSNVHAILEVSLMVAYFAMCELCARKA
jgi:hypothetical protein